MRIHHIAFRTRDLNGLVDFYADVLGLTPVREQSGYSVWFDLGTTVLMLEECNPNEPVIRPGTFELVAFEMNEAQRATLAEKLSRRGMNIEESGQYTTYFRDPDGRRIGVSHYDFRHRTPGDRGGS